MEDEDDWNLTTPHAPSVQVDGSNKPPAAECLVAFGHIGENRSKTHEGGWTEVTRVVGDIKYNQPPIPSIGWSTIAEHHFALIWADGAAGPPFPSLESLAVKFRRELNFQSDALLNELDKKFEAYLAGLIKLEQYGWTQGLVSPSSVLFRETEAETIAVFPDLGFYWIGDFGVPDWLRNHPGKEFFGQETPADRQEAWKPSQIENWKIGEVRIAAKMLAYCVGQTENSLKEISKEHTIGDAKSLGFLVVLRSAIDGKYPTASEFRGEVLRNPPSKSHSLRSTRFSEVSKLGLIKGLTLFLTVGVLAIVSLLGIWKFYPGKKAPDIDGVDKGSRVEPFKGPNLEPMAKDLIKELQKTPKSEREIREQKSKRDTFNKQFIKEFKEISEKYGEDQDRTSAIRSLKSIIEPMQSIVKVLNSTNENNIPEEESQCLAFAEAFLVQLSQ